MGAEQAGEGSAGADIGHPGTVPASGSIGGVGGVAPAGRRGDERDRYAAVMDLQTALDWAADRSHAVLITIRADGRPQSSDISYRLADGVFEISITDGRAKTANLRRDPRAVLHLTEIAKWSYLSFDGTVELSPPAAATDDETADALVEYYRAVAGQDHPDWAEYRQAMVDEGRLIARFTPGSVVGQING